jgi:hypothetical protein
MWLAVRDRMPAAPAFCPGCGDRPEAVEWARARGSRLLDLLADHVSAADVPTPSTRLCLQS